MGCQSQMRDIWDCEQIKIAMLICVAEICMDAGFQVSKTEDLDNV
jgi:hypothetical protein